MLASDRGIETFDAVLNDERLPEKFRTVRLPQMRDRIRTLRERSSS
jgi:aspartate/tyrosine/aromatic aminotransferase